MDDIQLGSYFEILIDMLAYLGDLDTEIHQAIRNRRDVRHHRRRRPPH